MNSQMEMSFPEAPEPPLLSEQKLMEQAQQRYGVFKPLVRGADDKWYVQDFNVLIEVEAWKKKQDALYSPEEGERRDLN